MKSKKYFYLIVFSVLTTFVVIIAQSFRPGEIPNGGINECANCHINPNGGGPRNAFGQTVESSFLSVPGPSGHVQWGPDLANIDSDNDGYTNGEELQDPEGNWRPGNPQPGDASLVTNPGDPNSKPDATSIDRINDNSIPNSFVLEQNYPNPFNPSTVINFSVAEPGRVSISVFNNLGQFVEELVNEQMTAGKYSVQWRAVNLASGVYYYTLSTANYRESKKMILMK